MSAEREEALNTLRKEGMLMWEPDAAFRQGWAHALESDEIKRTAYNYGIMLDSLTLIRDEMDKDPNGVLLSWVYRIVSQTIEAVE